jgi:Ribosomal protein L11 methyltransferase (PrmA)
MRLMRQPHTGNDLCFQDFFNCRLKLQMLRLADVGPTDVFFDLGCGNASILIFAVKSFEVKKAIGYEDNIFRYNNALKNIRKNHLLDRIIIHKEDMHNADLSEADVIFDMLPEGEYDVEDLYTQDIKNGARLLKHDLPLVGYIADKVDYPFYRMTFPLKKANNKNHWASHVLGKSNARIEDVWHELFFYEGVKHYTKWDIKRYNRILKIRL